MKWDKFYSYTKDRMVIESQYLYLLYHNKNEVELQLSRWAKQGKVHRLKKGYYILGEDYRRTGIFEPYIAAILKSPSYISLEKALEMHHLVPDVIYTFTSVTTRRRPKLGNELQDSSYNLRVKIKKDGVYSAMLKFSGLLFEAGMSHRKEENFSIKLEIDRRPPAGAQVETHIINKYFMSGVTCFNLATLFAGKINAVLTRNYVKGRDYYDLFWYLTTHKDLQPNIEFLKNAQIQVNGEESEANPDVKNWKSRVIETVTSVDWKIIQKDMALLLEDRDDLSLFNKENLLLLLNK